MRKLFYLCLTITILNGCVSKTNYTELENKCKSMAKEIIVLKAHIDELENGEDRLVNMYKNSYEAGNYALADKYIKQLKEKHPDSKQISYFNELQPILDKKIEEELALKEKVRQDSMKLANINNLGIWDLRYYVDDFGEPTRDAYVSTVVYGKFNNSATTNSELKVKFLIDKSEIRIQLYEYAGKRPINGEGFIYFKIRDKNNKEHEIKAYNCDNGETVVEQAYDKKLRDVLLSGGQIKFFAEAGKYGYPSTYMFTIENADWFENAITKMQLMK